MKCYYIYLVVLCTCLVNILKRKREKNHLFYFNIYSFFSLNPIGWIITLSRSLFRLIINRLSAYRLTPSFIDNWIIINNCVIPISVHQQHSIFLFLSILIVLEKISIISSSSSFIIIIDQDASCQRWRNARFSRIHIGYSKL